jgi:hypothetical protein
VVAVQQPPPTRQPTANPSENVRLLLAQNMSILAMGRPVGGTCNQLHYLSHSVKQAVERNATLIVWGQFKKIFLNLLDLEYMHQMYPQFRYLLWDNEPHAEELSLSPWDGIRCGLRYSSEWIQKAVRPHPGLRAQAENLINILRRKSDRVIAIHLRYFDQNCSPAGTLTRLKWTEEGRPCHKRNQSYVLDYDRICRYRLDQILFDSMHREWPELSSIVNFGAYVSTDDEREEYVKEFFDEDHARQFKFSAATRSPPKTNMLVDMWASTLADYYVSNPMSSCEPIIAQWRSQIPVNKGKMYPSACFLGFEDPSEKSEFQGVC